MSVSNIQKRRVINEILQKKFSQGVKPTPASIAKEVSDFFSKNKAGRPYTFDRGFAADGFRSDPNVFNQTLEALVENLTCYYLASQEQVGKLLLFNDYAQAKFQSIDDKRQYLLNRIEDYLLSIFNSDGYFYSHSDSFRSVDFVDLDLTTAFINTELTSVTIPVNTNISRFLTEGEVQVSSITFFNDDTGEELTSHENTGQDSAMFDGMSNTHWAYEVRSSSVINVRCDITFALSDTLRDVSKIAINPFGITESQYWVETRVGNEIGTFGGKIVTSLLPFSFDDQARNMDQFTLHVRKTRPDFEDYSSDGSIRYNYIIGFKDISIAKWIYENTASLITKPISLPDELFPDQTIDAVSLVVEDFAPNGSKINYYIAANDPELDDPSISSFDWKKINPLKKLTPEPDNIVRFNGSNKVTEFVRRQPDQLDRFLDLIDTTAANLVRRNPSEVIVEGTNVYKVTTFAEDYIPGTLSLEEGVDTVRIMVLPHDVEMLKEGLSYWSDYVRGIKEPLDTIYKDIRQGSDFFYGGLIGTPARSVYVETYIETLDEFEDQIRDLVKSDSNVKQWGIKLYLNGIEIADMPIGKDRESVRYSFNKGLNHLVMLITIPPATPAYPNVYVGSIDLMNTGVLQNYGSVRLSKVKYVDFFDFKYNYSEDSNVFSLYEGKIITFKKPTDNYRISYSTGTSAGPTSIRLRADFHRDDLHAEIAPHLDNYRLRFAYQGSLPNATG